ncbi:MAG: TetR/AcrR family transcriptional regulator, partial [Planctomycetia bacterium]|nr:TetR/AcrR family transcriptional regulator [Planctomycetia bacterium]
MKATRSSKTATPAPTPRLEQRREEILDAAIQHFARSGYADTDLQLLADDLGIGKGTLYRHFGSKENLFLAAADRVMLNLRQTIDDAIASIADPLERIERAIAAY